MESANRIWKLMARALSEEASEMELTELHSLLEADPDLRRQYHSLKSNWITKNATDVADDASDERKVRKILAKAEYLAEDAMANTSAKKIRKLYLPWGIAASVLLACLGFYQLHIRAVNANVAEVVKFKTISAKVADKKEVKLPDGSLVILNSDSKLSYDPDFNGKTREVRLEGEAYFDVTKQRDKPFIVHAGGIKIRVLGTAFNIKSYKDEKNIETTLLRGEIEVTGLKNREGKPLIMQPNQKLIVAQTEKNPVEQERPVQQLDIEPVKLVNLVAGVKQEDREETSWMYNRFEFRGDDFQTLAKSLERRLKIRVVFIDEEARKIRFNGSFENEGPEEVFSALQKVAPFTYNIKNNEVYIRSNK